MSKSKITVIGSLNIDIVVETPKIPTLGETVMGMNYMLLPGGKGNNQAVASARLGADVTIIGCVGSDSYGKKLINNLIEENINTDHIVKTNKANTGLASIMVQKDQNIICVIPGANNFLTKKHIQQKEEVIRNSDIILLQLEIPIETVIESVLLANKHNVPVILNPAPAIPLPEVLLRNVTYFTPNEHEIREMFNSNEVNSTSYKTLLQKIPGRIIMTKGKEGAFFTEKNTNKIIQIPSYQINTIDTTGAGDTFNAALAFKLCQNCNLEDATKFAVAAGALSTTKMGAQNGMPTYDEVNKFINSKCSDK